MRVLDLSRLLPGPYCTRILADLGADVVKIESPGGSDWARHAPPLGEDGVGLAFASLNRGKMSLTLNLKAAEGRRILLALAEKADVLIEAFRPGVMESLALGYDLLASVNPRLVYCSLSGYGPAGPYRDRAGHDLNYIGLTGLLDLTGMRDGPPVVPGTPVADITGGLWAAIGILATLLERERTGSGQRVDASLLGAALACLPLPVVGLLGGRPWARGAGDLNGGLVCYCVYETSDGGYVSLAALEPQFWEAFCRAAGCEGLVSCQFAPAVPGEPVYEQMRALFCSRSRSEWGSLLAGADACCEPVYTTGEALDSAPVQALGMLSGMNLLPPVRLSGAPIQQAQPVASLGEHTAALLGELGYTAADLERLRASGVV